MTSNDVNMTYNADTMKGVTLNVTVKPSGRYRLRVWIAILLIRLAARVAGYGIEVTR